MGLEFRRVLFRSAQLHQWQLWLDERSVQWPRLPPPLAARCREVFVAREGAPSKLQRDVVRVLGSLDLDPSEEVRTELGYSLDAVVRFEGRDGAGRRGEREGGVVGRRNGGGEDVRCEDGSEREEGRPGRGRNGKEGKRLRWWEKERCKREGRVKRDA